MIAGDDHMGVEVMLLDNLGGEEEILPRVEGVFLGIDPRRVDSHGDECLGGAAALCDGLRLTVEAACGDDHRLGVGGQIVVGGVDAVLQHGAGLTLIDAAAKQDDCLGGSFLRGGTVGGSHRHKDQHHRYHGQGEGEEGNAHGLCLAGQLSPQAREKAYGGQQHQQRRRPEHTDVAHAHGEGEEEVHRPQEAQCAEDG